MFVWDDVMFHLYLHEFRLRLCGFRQVVMHTAVTVNKNIILHIIYTYCVCINFNVGSVVPTCVLQFFVTALLYLLLLYF